MEEILSKINQWLNEKGNPLAMGQKGGYDGEEIKPWGR